MENAKDDFNRCIAKVEEETQGVGGDHYRMKCLTAYRDELKTQTPRVHSMYDGYLQNYNPKDGSLLKPFDD